MNILPNLWNQISSRTLILITNQISVFVVLIYLANHLDIETFSKLASALIILQVIAFFLDGGFFIPAIKDIKKTDDEYGLNKIFLEVYILKICIFIFISLFFIFINKYVNLFSSNIFFFQHY